MTAEIYSLSPSRHAKLQELFEARLVIAIPALILEMSTTLHLMRTCLFLVSIFNIPAIAALMVCTLQPKLLDCQVQKTIKTLLKVGIAKAVGGVLLALYIGMKYAYVAHDAHYNSNKSSMSLCAICLGGSAVIDIIYSIFAYMAIQKTKEIVQTIRKRCSCHHNTHHSNNNNKSSYAYSLPSSPSQAKDFDAKSTSDSSFCSEEESCEKDSHHHV